MGIHCLVSCLKNAKISLLNKILLTHEFEEIWNFSTSLIYRLGISYLDAIFPLPGMVLEFEILACDQNNCFSLGGCFIQRQLETSHFVLRVKQ